MSLRDMLVFVINRGLKPNGAYLGPKTLWYQLCRGLANSTTDLAPP